MSDILYRNHSFRLADDGETPVSMTFDEYLQWLKRPGGVGDHDPEYGRIGKDTFEHDGGEILVSTVFLSINHAYDDGSPVLWETMIFGMNDEDGYEYQERYTSAADARVGHQRAIEHVKDTIARTEDMMPDEQTAREIIRQAFTEPIDDCNEWIESPLDCGARNALAALAEAGYVLTTMDEVRRIEIEYGESIALQPGDLDPLERTKEARDES